MQAEILHGSSWEYLCPFLSLSSIPLPGTFNVTAVALAAILWGRQRGFWAWGWAYSAWALWVRGELCGMKAWAVLPTRGQGHWPAVGGPWQCPLSGGDGSVLISGPRRLLCPLRAMTSTSEGTGTRGALSSRYMRLATTSATLEPQTKKKLAPT